MAGTVQRQAVVESVTRSDVGRMIVALQASSRLEDQQLAGRLQAQLLAADRAGATFRIELPW